MSMKDEWRSSVLILRDATEVLQKLKRIYQTVFEPSIDAKMTKLQTIKMMETNQSQTILRAFPIGHPPNVYVVQ